MNDASSASVRRLSYPVMLSYGVGQVGEAIVGAAFATFLLFYYNQVLRVSGTITGIALAVSLVVDAFIDPSAGAMSDRLRSRWGRRHPFMLFSALPLGLGIVLIFNPPEGLAEWQYGVWLVAFTLFTRIAQTFYSVPHLALGAEMAHDYQQRSTLYSFNFLFSTLGAAGGAAIAYAAFFPTTPEFNPGLLNAHGYLGFSLCFAALAVIAIWACVLGTWREIPHLAEGGRNAARLSVRQMLREVREAFANRSFRALFAGMSLATVMLSLESVLLPFMGVHFWGFSTEQLSLMPFASMLGLCLGMVLVPHVTRVLDKKRTLMTCSFISLASSNVFILLRLADVPWMPANGSPFLLPLILAGAFVGGVLGPLTYGSLNSMFADIVDEHELEIGYRREGVIFGARSFLIKVISSLGIMLGGLVLELIRFPRGATAGTVPEDVLWLLGLLQSPLPSVFLVLAVVLYGGYALDRVRHAEILAALERRRSSGGV